MPPKPRYVTTLSEFLTAFADRVEQQGACLVWLGTKSGHGYGQVRVNEQRWHVHRLTYTLTHGPIPAAFDIDHACHNRACIKPEHLRIASHRDNLRNRRGADRTSRSGVRGVRWREDGKKWEARIKVDDHEVHLGRFTSIEDAEQAVTAARAEYFGEFAGNG